MEQKMKKWEKQFDNKFIAKTSHNGLEGFVVHSPNLIKEFILELLHSQKVEILDEVIKRIRKEAEGIRKEENQTIGKIYRAHNKALSDILNILEGEMKHKLKLLYLWLKWNFADTTPKACTFEAYLHKIKLWTTISKNSRIIKR